MDLDSISVFIKVIQAGSFSKAAKLLGMPNTTVSAKVSHLEKKLGVSLIQRTTRKLNVTQAGEAFFRRCVVALEEIHSAENEVTSKQTKPTGLLRLTAASDVGHSLLAPLVSHFLKKYPEMEVDLIVTNRVVDLIGEGVDIGIRAGELEDSTLLSKKLISARMSFVASPSYLKKNGTPSHPKDLLQHEFIHFSEFQNVLVLHKFESNKSKETYKLKVKSRIKADDLETLKGFARIGQGITLVPNFLCQDEVEQGKLVHLLPQWQIGSGHFTLVYPAQTFIPPKVQAFVETSVDYIQGFSRA
jgi:DNA-binding transcriptional LysR family regulator